MDRSEIENSKTTPPATQIDGHDFPAGTLASEQNDTLAVHGASQLAPTVTREVTPHSPEADRAPHRPWTEAPSGARVTEVHPHADAARPTWASNRTSRE